MMNSLPKDWIERSRKEVYESVAALPREIVEAAKKSFRNRGQDGIL